MALPWASGELRRAKQRRQVPPLLPPPTRLKPVPIAAAAEHEPAVASQRPAVLNPGASLSASARRPSSTTCQTPSWKSTLCATLALSTTGRPSSQYSRFTSMATTSCRGPGGQARCKAVSSR
ncbi:hypothetical protein BRADI_3g22796v3 [Brachypodium distachyon]|uniref:Uncharacterized protein n=1 Tax=Brachypodium distachyon TaxID=15368 RepID=A0A0Q3JDJ5_BRADI|nr:hypothetical protein BRADI_3g22796v3 [Brachypodium distachyon]